MNKTEIFILSGFLGSGKTTLLKQLITIEKRQGRKVAVLMNELGKVSIDSNEVENDIPLKELLDGCICCTIQDKLEAQLQTLLLEEKPEVIYIESTGVAHPVEIVDSILSPIIANQLSMKGILTVVDGKRWLDRRDLSPQIQQLLLEQVRHADLLLLNKSEELTDFEQFKLVNEIQSINPQALALLTSFSKISYDQIFKLKTKRNISSNIGSHVQTDLKLSSFVYKFNKEINQSEFERFLRELPDSIYRIKGYVKFYGSAHPFLFQYSYGMPLYMKEYMNMPLTMVFIGEDINWEAIKSKLVQLEQ